MRKLGRFFPWIRSAENGRERLLAPGAVGAGEACDLLILILIFRLGFKCLGKDRSLVALDSSYTAPTQLLYGSQLP